MDKEKIIHFINEHRTRVIAVAALLVVAIIVVFTAKFSSRKADPLFGARENYKESTNDKDINGLLTDYYNAYCSNDMETLEKIAVPVSDMEKSYVEFMSGYTEKYEIEKIFSKPGSTKGSYLVSVRVNIKFADIDTVSPGLDFFYLVPDDKGALYIDNRYSAFNQVYAEEEVDPTIQALKDEYETQSDLVELRLDVDKQYNDLINSDEQFATFINSTLHDAIVAWYRGYTPDTLEADASGSEEKSEGAEEEAKEEESTEEEPAEEETPEQEEPAEEEPAEEEAPAEEKPAPANGFKAGDTVTITDILNIREEPDANSTKCGAALDGATLTIIEDSGANGWTKIRLNNKEGYIRTDLLK